jgi:hypothetical protein
MSDAIPNSERYHFADFTHEGYRDLLELARKRFVFRVYDDYRRDEPFILWRHDLDFAVSDALPLARLESQGGIRATYFVHLHGDFYNPFSVENLAHLADIASLGHAIGLHFDFDRHRIGDEGDLCACLGADARRLQEECGQPVTAFSFHTPSAAALAFDGETYAGMVNTYSRYFREQVNYCSDSNGHWAHQRLRDVLEQPAERPLQVLTHPTWWSREVMSPRQKVEAVVAAAARDLLARHSAALRAYGRIEVDW